MIFTIVTHPIPGRNAKKLLHILLLSKPLSVNTKKVGLSK